MHKIFVDPPELLRWLPRDGQTQVVFLDFEPDFLDENTIRMDLNVVFRPILITRGWSQTKDYYIGCTGARLLFETFNGQVRSYTKGKAIDVDYEHVYTRSRTASVKVAPKMQFGKKAEVDPGELSFDHDNKRFFRTNFSGAERMLSDIDLGYGVEWELKLPAGQVIRDYLIGNLFLYVESSWACNHKSGRIVLRPSDVLFFDSQRRIIGDGYRALAMRYVLWKKGIKLDSRSIIVNFEEVK